LLSFEGLFERTDIQRLWHSVAPTQPWKIVCGSKAATLPVSSHPDIGYLWIPCRRIHWFLSKPMYVMT
jgi:hypothetical protein